MAEMTIKRFGVWSVAKINAVLWFIFGLIVGVIYGLFFMLFGAAMSSLAPERDAAAMGGISSVVTGLIIMVAMPMFYGITGLIAGAIGALVYNLLAGVIGGIKFELEGVQAYAPPPPPTDWAPNQYAAQ